MLPGRYPTVSDGSYQMGDFWASAESSSHTTLGVICGLAVGSGGHLLAMQPTEKHLNMKGF